MDKELKKKKSLLIIGIISLVIILLGSTYAFFTYTREQEAFSITNGNIEALFTGGTNSVNFKNAYPISDTFALQNLDNLTYIDFTVSSNVLDETQAISYEIYLEENTGNTLSSDYVKVYLTDENNNQVVSPKIYSSLENTTYTGSTTGKVIYKDTNPGEFTKNYRLYIWLDSSYTQNEVSQTFSFKVNIYAYNNENQNLSYVFKNAIAANTDESCNPIVEDDDGTIYMSGTNDCVDFNYVWYSGKLWRITAIYPDGTMKMITDGLITTIAYGSDNKFYTDENTTSYMYQWLNQEFLPTLYNYENIIVEDAVWNATSGNGSIEYKLPETTMLSAKVGILNSYEYYKSYQNTSYDSGYLNTYSFWLLNPYSASSSNVWHGINSGGAYGLSPSSNGHGVRPSIYLKSEVQLEGGFGTENEPYRIKRDQEQAKANVTLINTRQSGEYIKIEGDVTEQLFRIVDKELVGEKVTTKIVLTDYLKESGNALTKYFSDSSSYELWSEVNSTDTTYWRGYLNTTWLQTLNTSMLEKGTYYLGYHSSQSYKTTVCSTVSSDVSIKGCIENGTIVSNISSDDYVGLLRLGEMFASQIRDSSSTTKSMWLITPDRGNHVWHVGVDDYLQNNIYPHRGSFAVRPTIHLTSTVVIKSGSGTKQDPFVVSLPTT